MITSWAAGRDVDASGQPLSTDRAWQAELWRRLRAELDLPDPVERVDIAAAALRSAPERSDLPERISVFGPTRLEPDHLLVLDALAEHRTSICGCRIPHPCSGTASPNTSRPAAGPHPAGRARRTRPIDWSRTSCWPIWAAIRGSFSSASAPLTKVASDEHYPAPATIGRLQPAAPAAGRYRRRPQPAAP